MYLPVSTYLFPNLYLQTALEFGTGVHNICISNMGFKWKMENFTFTHMAEVEKVLVD
jgi:hypothetical protein